jgi:hypothetical protein
MVRTLTVAMFAATLSTAHAVPIQLTHQGALGDAAGAPVNGSSDFVVRLMDAPTAGGEVWSDTFTGVPIARGTYSLVLGSGAALDTADLTGTAAVWIELEIDGQVIGSRMPLVETPFAAVAREVRGPVYADSVVVAGNTVIDGTGAVLGAGPTNIICNDGETVVQTGDSWGCAANQLTPSEVAAALAAAPADLHVNTRVGGQLLHDSQNIRTIYTKANADSRCGSATAVHVPWTWRGKTGTEICAGDGRGLTTCNSVRFVYITNGHSAGSYDPNNLSCSAQVNNPWPWGNQYSVPNSLSAEWGHGNTHVVCCQ